MECWLDDLCVMTRTGVRKKLGELNIFYADNKLFQSTELALARAWSIVEAEKRSADSEHPKARPSGVTAADIMTSR